MVGLIEKINLSLYENHHGFHTNSVTFSIKPTRLFLYPIRLLPTWACMYSLPLLHSFSLLLWVYEAILPKHGCHFKQLPVLVLIKSKVLNILIYCTCNVTTCEEVHHAPTVQIWAQNSTILPPNTLLIVWHSSNTNWSQNTLSLLQVSASA